MEPDISTALDGLEKRIAFQESLHQEINPKTNSFVHWDNTATMTVVVSVLLTIAVTIFIVNINKS